MPLVSRTPRAVICRSWDGCSVLYDRSSGDTVFLDESASFLLADVETAPADAGSLACRLGAQFALDAEDAAQLAERALAELAGLGLIDRQPA